ncbi:hypothetical protein DXF85_24465 [Citrobacter pasteurii]|uniref:Uncharacterized protein n=1 Tax=Citrobacter pasteurii TaxID=1563222 RepID=A0A6N6JWY3_9ENTR|nr:hypothetical protein DXF85_24465 [Citrobacter pasteurii]
MTTAPKSLLTNHLPFPHQQLMKCACVGPEEKSRAREKKLRQVVCSVGKNIRPPHYSRYHCLFW